MSWKHFINFNINTEEKKQKFVLVYIVIVLTCLIIIYINTSSLIEYFLSFFNNILDITD